MHEELLQTKLIIPTTHSKLIDRPKLVLELDAIFENRLSIISAPPGYGKTTTLAVWSRKQGNNIGWLSLDEEDNSLERFLQYFIQAIINVRRVQHTGRDIGVFSISQNIDSLLFLLLNWISKTDEELTIVLDNYEVIFNDEIHEKLEYILKNSPDWFHLVLITRSDIPFAISKFRASGILFELDAKSLRFSAQEAGEFIHLNEQVALSEEQRNQLILQTEGWPAGLKLVLLSLDKKKDINCWINSIIGNNEFISEYLIEEVLEKQPLHVREFLIDTSILDTLTVSICNALRNKKDSQELLVYLNRNNLFIDALNDNKHYRYHKLFQEILINKFSQSENERILGNYRKAASIYAENKDIRTAIRYLFLSEDYKEIVDLLEKNINKLWSEGQQSRILKWFNSIPEKHLAGKFRLQAYKALALIMMGNIQAGQAILNDIEEKECSEPLICGMVASGRAYIAYFQRDPGLMGEYAQIAIQLLPEEYASWYLGLQIIIANAQTQSGYIYKANNIFQEIILAGNQTGNDFMVLAASLQLSINNLQQGDFEGAIKISKNFINDEKWKNIPDSGTFFAVQAEVYREQNRLVDAKKLIDIGLSRCEAGGSIGSIGWVKLAMVRLYYSMKEYEEALAYLEELSHISSFINVPPWFSWGLLACKQIILIAMDKYDTVQNILDLGHFDEDIDLQFASFEFHLARLAYCISIGRMENNLDLLYRSEKNVFRLIDMAKEMHWNTYLLRAILLLCKIKSAEGKPAQAQDYMEQALRLGSDGKYISVFVNNDPFIPSMISEIVASDKFVEYGREILKAYGKETIKPTQRLVEEFSEKELQVLHYLSTSLSVSEIAEKLFVAPSTIRTHIKSIYGKMNAHRRIEAVVKGKDMGLI